MMALAQILTRVTIGLIFIDSGWHKFGDLPRIVEFFESLGIPAPHLQAPFVAGVELLCGLLILVGLFTRLASVPLIATMVVAIVTAKLSDVDGFVSFLALAEFQYILLLIWLMASGSGRFSVDYFLLKSKKLTSIKKCI